jgi:hypothetical protein
MKFACGMSAHVMCTHAMRQNVAVYNGSKEKTWVSASDGAASKTVERSGRSIKAVEWMCGVSLRAAFHPRRRGGRKTGRRRFRGSDRCAVEQAHTETPVSWSVGTFYRLFPGISLNVGVFKGYLTNFNSENTQNGIGAPESALQYDASIKFSLLNDRGVLNASSHNISRCAERQEHHQ